MRLDTKFDLGSAVVGIRSQQKEYWARCEFCDATSEVTGANGESRRCPECHGRKGRKAWEPEAWRVVGTMTVGQVRVVVTAWPGDALAEEYMLVETGVGSGQVWQAADLFATLAEAEAACAERNTKDVAA
jgi:hypothetical protein